jgi:hypothetical protein
LQHKQVFGYRTNHITKESPYSPPKFLKLQRHTKK